MARYNNNNGGFANGYNNGGSYSKGYNNGGNYNNPPRKLSGSSFKMMQDGTMVISAWRKNKHGFFKLYARPYKNTKEHIGKKSGKTFLNYFVTVTNMSTGQVQNLSGLFYPSETKLRLPDINQVVSRAGNGGYWGKAISKNYNRR